MKEAGRDNYRIEVYPREPGDFGGAYVGGMTQSHDELMRQLERMQRQIERHIDGLPSRGVKSAIFWDTHYVCEHCERDIAEQDETECSDCGEKICQYCSEQDELFHPICFVCWEKR